MFSPAFSFLTAQNCTFVSNSGLFHWEQFAVGLQFKPVKSSVTAQNGRALPAVELAFFFFNVCLVKKKRCHGQTICLALCFLGSVNDRNNLLSHLGKLFPASWFCLP